MPINSASSVNPSNETARSQRRSLSVRSRLLVDDLLGALAGSGFAAAIAPVEEASRSAWLRGRWLGRHRGSRHEGRHRALDDLPGVGQGRRALGFAGREARKLHEIRLSQKALDFVEHDDTRRGGAQFAEHFAGGALEAVEAVAVA